MKGIASDDWQLRHQLRCLDEIVRLRALERAARKLLLETPPYVMGRDAIVGVRLGLLIDVRDALEMDDKVTTAQLDWMDQRGRR